MKFSKIKTAVFVAAVAPLSAFAVGPSAGDLTALTPDAATILTAIGAVALVLIGVQLAIKGYHIVSALAKSR